VAQRISCGLRNCAHGRLDAADGLPTDVGVVLTHRRHTAARILLHLAKPRPPETHDVDVAWQHGDNTESGRLMLCRMRRPSERDRYYLAESVEPDPRDRHIDSGISPPEPAVDRAGPAGARTRRPRGRPGFRQPRGTTRQLVSDS
jgi:hypothetical protein